MTSTGIKHDVYRKTLDKTYTIVKKPIEAIQCANTFSLLQRKIYNALLANAANNLLADVTHRISICILCKLIGYNSRDYETLKNRFRELRRMDIEWDIVNDQGNKVWTNTSPLSMTRIIEGEGICEYEFTKSLIPYLARPSQYALLSLPVQAKFKSGYGLALYENCERYKNVHKTRIFDVPTFRKLMGLKEGQYEEFFSLKRRVIQQAIKEVNAYADFEIQARYGKKGKQTVSIQFFIFLKSDYNSKSLLCSISSENEGKLFAILKQDFGFNSKFIESVIKKYGEIYIWDKIRYVKNSTAFQKGEIDNIAAYLKSALLHDYRMPVDVKAIIQKEKTLKEAEKKAFEDQKKIMEDRKTAYSRFLNEFLINKIDNLDDDTRKKILTNFETYLQSGTNFYQIYNKKGYRNSAIVCFSLKEFIDKNYKEILTDVPSFEQFLEIGK